MLKLANRIASEKIRSPNITAFNSNQIIVRILGAIASGILLILIHPTPDQGWLAWVCLVPILLACHRSSIGFSSLLGLITGLIYAYGVFFWFFHLPKAGAVQSIPLAIIIALYVAVFAAFASRINNNFLRLLVLPCIWITVEWLRAHAGFLSLPWATLAHSQHQNIGLLQYGAFTGTYGISFIIVAGNVLLANMIIMRKVSIEQWLGISTILLLHLYGHSLIGEPELTKTQKIMLVQPHISVHEVRGEQTNQLRWQKLDRLTRKAIETGIDLVVWPETVLRGLKSNPLLMRNIQTLCNDYQISLLSGVTEFEKFTTDGGSKGEGEVKTRSFNSIVFVVPDKPSPVFYNKLILVPFGEYTPLSDYLSWPQWLAPVASELTRGDAYVHFAMPEGTIIGPLICWENLFPDFVRQSVMDGAQVLVQVVNNNWFGQSAQPFQHNIASVMRAVENRRSVVVASNSGPSQVVDPWGRVTAVTPEYFSKATLISEVQINDIPSFYSRHGDLFLWFVMGFSALALLLSLLSRQTSHTQKNGRN